MTSFCTDTIRFAPNLRPERGILRAEALSLTADAQRAAQLLLRRAKSDGDAIREEARVQSESALEAARAQVQEMLEAARADAQQLRDTAQEDARQLAEGAQQRVFEQAAELLALLEQASAAIVERVEGTAIELTQKLFDKLVAGVTPREKLEIALKHVLQEAPPKLVDPLLRVHPDDMELLPEVDWPVKGDASIARGTCRLEAASGQWCAGFEAAVDALKAAFQKGVEETRTGTPDEDGQEEAQQADGEGAESAEETVREDHEDPGEESDEAVQDAWADDEQDDPPAH